MTLQISDIISLVSTYLDSQQVNQIVSAYRFSDDAHKDQNRASGEPYINHPLAVAYILGEMCMDHQTLIAAILHDVIEDTGIAKEEIAIKFDEDVATLVDGVSKLANIPFASVEDEQAQNFQKMLMAMSSDIRVILIKLADRLHNMRTLEALSVERRIRISNETLDIYVPIARRFGLEKICLELEDIAFRTKYPWRYKLLTEQLSKARGNRSEVITQIKKAIQRRMMQEELVCTTHGREKHLYGIYQKMRRNRLSFDDVYDVYAFRILVKDVDQCYQALGIVHNLYKPKPNGFEDYIALPKANGYQSLHTILFGPFNKPIEIQIRTVEMNDVAEAGIAAHWLYKSGEKHGDRSGAHSKAREWLRGIMEMHKTAGNPQEFIDNVKIDLFPGSVYVFTPKGAILELSKGATAIDFAYAIHTDVGNTCTGARIDRRLAPLSTRLQSGQAVEIITSPNATPNPGWLNFATTVKARSSIRHYLKNIEYDEAGALGLRLLNRELNTVGYRYDQIGTQKLEAVLQEYQLSDEQALFAEIGLGNRLAPLIARHIIETVDGSNGLSSIKHQGNEEPPPFAIKGTEGMVVNFPKCCYPIPGDLIYGFISAGRGIIIHCHTCSNVSTYHKHPEKWIDVQWEETVERTFPTTISMDTINQRGVLAKIAAVISEQDVNIVHVDIEDKDDRNTVLRFEIEVKNRQHLSQVIRHIKRIKHISHIRR